MKTNKLLLSIFLIFIIIFYINFVIAEVSIKVEPDKTINDLDSQTSINVNNLQNYIKQNIPDLNNNPDLGKIVVDVDGKIRLYYNNKIVFDIPKGIKLTFDGKKMVFSGSVQSVYTTTSNGRQQEIPSLVIKGIMIGSEKSKTFSAYFEENNGIINLRVTGGMGVSQYNSDRVSLSYMIYNLKDGTLKIDSNKKQLISVKGVFGDYGGDIRIGGSETSDTSFKLNYLGLKNAEMNFNDKNEVEYAKLASLKEQTYSFDYNGKKFVFGTNKDGGEVIFDPLHQIISGTNANLAFSKMVVDSKGTFTGSLDADGNIVSLSLDNKGKFKDDRGNDYSSSKSLKVYLDGKDIKSEENAVSFILGSESKTTLKGLVDVITTSKLHYSGNEKAYTLFDSRINNDYGKPFFEVKEGIAQIDNGNAKILVRDGKILLNKIGLSDRNGFGPEFVVKATGKDQKETLANIVYTNDDFSISIKSFINGKETDTKVVALSKVSETMSLSNLLFNSENVLVEKAYAKARLEQLQAELEITRSNDFDPEIKSKIDALELDIVNNQNKLEGDVDKSIGRIRDYLDSQNREDESRMTAQLRLAELIGDKASLKYQEFRAASKDVKPEGVALLTLDEIGSEVNKIKDESLKIYSDLIRESKGNNENVFLAASFGLAESYKKTGDFKQSVDGYLSISGSSEFSDVVRSEAMRQAAIIATETGSRSDALKYLEQSISLNSDNVNSQIFGKNVQLTYLRQMVGSMGNEETEAYQTLLSSIGYNRAASITTSNEQLLANVNSAAAELTEQQLGAFANMYALDNGLTLKEFYSQNQEQRIKTLESYWIRQGMNPGKDSEFIARLVSGSFKIDNNPDMMVLRDPIKNSDLTLTLDTPGKKYMQQVFSIRDDILTYVNPFQAAALLLPFASVSYGGKIIGTVGSLMGEGLNAATLGGAGVLRTTMAENLGAFTTDLLLGTGLSVGAYQIPGEVYGIGVGEVAAQAAAMISFERLVTQTLEKVAGKFSLEAAGAFKSEVGGELKLIPAFRVVGAEADATAETLAQKGLRMIETETGEKLFVPDSAEVEGLEYLLKRDLQVGASSGLRGAQQNLDEAVDSLDAAFASPTGCFLAGTRIMLSDGSYRNIEDIQEGDSVKSYDLTKKLVVDSNVTMTFVRKSDSYRIIEYEILG